MSRLLLFDISIDNMISNRVYQLFHSIHLRRCAVPIYFHNSLRTNFNGKHNLSVVKKIGSNSLLSSKCSPLFVNSLCSPVRHYALSDRPDSLGEVRLLRGLRGDFRNEVVVPSPFQSMNYILKLTTVLNRTSLWACFEFISGFEQGFVVYNELLRKRNPDDLEKEWLQLTAQEDSRDIMNRLPADYWEVVENCGILLVPFCIGYKVDRSETPPSVDTAILLPCGGLLPGDRKLFWHLVFTRKFGEGCTDSWTIKHVAVFLAT